MTSNEKLLELLIAGEYLKMRECLEVNILESELPKAATKELSFIKKYMKTIERENLKGYIEEDGKYYICNSYSLIEISQSYNYSSAETNLKPSYLFPDIKYYEEYKFDYKELLNSLKLTNIENKNLKDKKPHLLNENTAVNAKYMLDIITFMGSDIKIFLGDGVNPIYIENSEGKRAILLPVRIKSEI